MSQLDELLFTVRCATLQNDALSLRALERTAAGVSDWDHVVRLAIRNRVAPLVYTNLRSTGLSALVPRTAMRDLETSYYQSLAAGTRSKPATRQVLTALSQNAVDAILLRGLALGERIYGDPALRPFSDLDLLVRKEDALRTKEILLNLGYSPPPGGVDTRYFERNHLHLQLAMGAEIVELHWALDHKYTLFMIDYAEIFRDGTAGTVAGVETLCLSPEDLLLTLCIHLVKHCTYSRYVAPGPELLDRVASAGFLVLYCDVAALLRRRSADLDWAAVVEKARRWQVESAVQPALAAAAGLFAAPVPPDVLASLSPPKVGRFERAVLSRTAADSLDQPRDGGHPRRGKWLNVCSDLVFRPMRALDLCQYLWPPAAFIARRYGAANSAQIGLYRCVHVGRALGELLINLGDVVYYAGLKPRISGIRSKRTAAPPRRQPH